MDVNFIMIFKIALKGTHHYEVILYLGQNNDLILSPWKTLIKKKLHEY